MTSNPAKSRFFEYATEYVRNPSARPGTVSAVGYPINNVSNYLLSCCCMFIVNCRLLPAPQSVSCSADRVEALMHPVRLSLRLKSLLRLSSSMLRAGIRTRGETL